MKPANSVALVSIVIFFGLTAMGLPLPTLPSQLVKRFAFDMNAVGWTMAAQSMATLLSRPWAGRLVDRYGARYAVMAGLVAMMISGLAYEAAALGLTGNMVGIGLIVVGRILTGLGEGLIITGGGTWAVGLAGMDRAGWAMSWIGLAMFGGLSAGAAVGALFEFRTVAEMTTVVAIAGLAAARRTPAIGVRPYETRTTVARVIAMVWWPGFALGLSAFGFAVVSSFTVLLFNANGWPGGGMAVALFGMGHVSARIFLSRLPDGTRKALPTLALVLVEAAGLLLLSAPVPALAFAGAALAGFGFSMIYPMMAVPMLRNIPESARGMAIGIYDAFFDVAMGAASVTCGLVAQRWGLSFAFFFAALVVTASGVAAVAGLRSQKS